jgi:hypothetical protein
VPVAATKLKTFQVVHPLTLAFGPGIVILPAVEFELFHLHLIAAEFFIHSEALLQARCLAALGAFWAEFMQSDMLGDKDCERSDQHRLFHLSCENLCRTPEIALPIQEIPPETLRWLRAEGEMTCE